MLKDKLQTRQISIEAKVVIIRENQVVEETRLKNKKYRRNWKRTMDKYGRIIVKFIYGEEFIF